MPPRFRGKMAGMTTTAGPAPLSAEEISKLLKLTKQADSVELKLTVPETASGFRSTAAALQVDVLDAQIRQVFFFDTPDLLLNQHGVVVRARRAPHARAASGARGAGAGELVRRAGGDATRAILISGNCQLRAA